MPAVAIGKAVHAYQPVLETDRSFVRLKEMAVPSDGWIKAIRSALSMTLLKIKILKFNNLHLHEIEKNTSNNRNAPTTRYTIDLLQGQPERACIPGLIDCTR